MTPQDYTPKTLSEQIRKLMTAILNDFVKHGVIGLAFDHNDTPRKYHRIWKDVYPEYKEMFEVVNERFVDGLESVAIERAKEKSDALMVLLLKANRPEKYNLSTDVNLSAKNDVHFIFPEGMLTPEEQARLGAVPNNED